MPEILEPPKKVPELVKTEQAEDAYWQAVDAFIALREGAAGDQRLETVVQRLISHIQKYEEQVIIYNQFNKEQSEAGEYGGKYDYEEANRLGKIRETAHNLIIEDINDLFTEYLQKRRDVSWRRMISEKHDLTRDDARAGVSTWARNIAKYLSRKQHSQAA